MKKILILLALCFGFSTGTTVNNLINPEASTNSYCRYVYARVGAVCNDGTTSSATGSGACSWHGGVSYWLYDYVYVCD